MPSSNVVIADVVFVDSYTFESEHPYFDDFDYTWTKTISGAASVAVLFDQEQ